MSWEVRAVHHVNQHSGERAQNKTSRPSLLVYVTMQGLLGESIVYRWRRCQDS